jgi:hypothetical protein
MSITTTTQSTKSADWQHSAHLGIDGVLDCMLRLLLRENPFRSRPNAILSQGSVHFIGVRSKQSMLRY